MKSFPQETFLKEMNDDEQVAQLDPLNLDEFLLHKLPKLNRSANTSVILEMAQKLTLSRIFSELEAKAAVRDVGIIVSSLEKHGITLAQLPHLETLLVEFAKITQEIPFKTVFSASTRNCQKNRMRTFTDDEQEKAFIRGLFKGMVNMPLCIHKLLELMTVSISNLYFSDLIQEIRTHFSGMIVGMVNVRRSVTADFFTNVLHSYFLPVKVAGRIYAAESAAQMPILLVDRILWSAHIQDAAYEEYYVNNLQYSPRLYREIGQELPTIPILGRVTTEVKNLHNTFSQRGIILQNLENFEEIFLDLLKFRGPHRATVEDNFQLRPQGAVGSGGYSVTMLDYLIAETKKARKQVINLKQMLK